MLPSNARQENVDNRVQDEAILYPDAATVTLLRFGGNERSDQCPQVVLDIFGLHLTGITGISVVNRAMKPPLSLHGWECTMSLINGSIINKEWGK